MSILVLPKCSHKFHVSWHSWQRKTRWRAHFWRLLFQGTFGSKRWDISGAEAIKYVLKAARRVISFIWCAHTHAHAHAQHRHTLALVSSRQKLSKQVQYCLLTLGRQTKRLAGGGQTCQQWIQQVALAGRPLLLRAHFLSNPPQLPSCFYSLPGPAEFFPLACCTCIVSAWYRVQVEHLPANELSCMQNKMNWQGQLPTKQDK